MTPKLHLTFASLLLLCVLGSSAVQTHAQTPGDAAFQRLDKNGEGELAEVEA